MRIQKFREVAGLIVIEEPSKLSVSEDSRDERGLVKKSATSDLDTLIRTMLQGEVSLRGWGKH